MRRLIVIIFYIIAFLALDINAEREYDDRGRFFIKLSPSFVMFSDISISKTVAVSNNITRLLEDYKKDTALYSGTLGLYFHVNEKVSSGVEVSYFPNAYSQIYNNQDISKLDANFLQLKDSEQEKLKNAQNYIFNGLSLILFSIHYDLPNFKNITPFLGAKIGYANGKVGLDPEFFDLQEKIANSNNFTITRDKNKEKIKIEIAKFYPLALGVEAGFTVRFKQNILFDISYELNKLKLDDIIDRSVGTTKSPIIKSYGIKDDLFLHKISAGLRLLL